MTSLSKDSPTINIRLISDFDEFLALETAWDDLLKNQTFATIYQTFAFNLTWWNTFGEGCTLQVLVAEDADKVVCIMPLMLTEDGKVRFLGHPNFDYHNLIGKLNSKLSNGFVDFLRKNNLIRGGLELSHLSERSPNFKLLQKTFEDSGLPIKIKAVENCLALNFAEDETERSNFTLRKGRNFKKAVNFYKSFGGYQLSRIDDLDIALTTLQMMFQLHISRWKDSSTPSKFEQVIHRDFHIALVKSLWPSGNIVLIKMSAGEMPISYSLNFEFGGSVFHYTLSYNNFLFKRSPGSFFFTAQSEQFVRSGLNLDFGRGTQGYKKEIATESFVNFEIVVFASRLGQIKRNLREAIKSWGPIKKLGTNQKFQRFRDGLSRKISSGGLPGLIRGFINSLTKRVVRKDSVRLYSLDKEALKNLPNINDIKVREVSSSDLPLLGTFAGLIDESPAYREFEQRLQDNHRAFIAIQDKLIVGLGWVSENNFEIPKIGKQLTVLPNEIALYDIRLTELVNQTEVLDSLLGIIFEAVASHNRIRIRTFASNENKKMSNLLTKSGFVRQSTVSRLSIFGS